VFDSVFKEDLAEALGGYGPGVYRREGGEDDVLEPVEEFIESILGAVGDTAKEVEYWGREEWLAVEGHRDCDEGAAECGTRRFPDRVYIAYLDIEPGLLAPTMLWTPNGANQFAKLVAVPAVPGRLLSFDGSLLHAVPRPACRYLGEVDLKDTDSRLRHVLIMNSWADHAPFPEEYEDNSEESDNEEYEDGKGSDPCLMAPSCLPRALWQVTPLRKQSGGVRFVDPDDPRELPAYSFSMEVFGSDDDIVTSMASKQSAMAMLNEPYSPTWLSTTLAAGSFNAADLRIGIPSIAGSRVERAD